MEMLVNSVGIRFCGGHFDVFQCWPSLGRDLLKRREEDSEEVERKAKG